MFDDRSVCVKNVSKSYRMFDQPVDRLKQALFRGRKQFFREFKALDDISFQLKKGETLGIIGSNGSGKSTLLQLICGIIHPTDGEIMVNGRVAALLELGSGFNPEFSGSDNIRMNAAVMGLTQKEIEDRYEDILEFADIGDFIHQPVKTYSSGMYVRLAFATAINVSPEILIVDEALSVGDIRFQQKCVAKIRNFCASGTVIFVSHDMSNITELCNRAIWLEKGVVRSDGDPKSVVEKYRQFMYEGEVGNDKGSSDSEKMEDAGETEGFIAIDNRIRQFGNRKVDIKKVRMTSRDSILGTVYSGEPCEISMIFRTNAPVMRPMAGFVIKDHLGRDIVGECTDWISTPIQPLEKGKTYHLSFRIAEWPNLRVGEYTLSVAIADGTMEDHEQCHWLHDVIVFKSVPVRPNFGIMSITQTDFSLKPITLE